MSRRRPRSAMAGFAAMALAAWPAGLGAQEAELKIGVVHFEEVVESSPEFERASAQWSAIVEERTDALQLRQRTLREAELELSGPEAPTGEVRADLIRGIDRLRTDIERANVDLQEELNTLREQLITPVVEKIHALVQTYSEENGFDLVLDTSSPEIGLTLAVQEIEITDELLEILRATDTPPGTPEEQFD